MKDNAFSEDEVQHMLDNLDSFSDEEIAEIDKLVEELGIRKRNKTAYDDLIEFCKRMQDDYIVGRHHRILADLLMAIEAGDEDRVCVNIPPRHGKSQLVSIFFPAWFLGRNPNKKVMMVSHTTDLAVDFGRKVRNLISIDDYKEIFPTVKLAVDSKSAGRWNTNFGGEYYACGVGSALAGRGADLLLIDDPHSEQDVINGNFSVFERAYEWYTFGARTRLMPGGSVAIIQTRWHMDDLTGRVTNDMVKNENSDQFQVVEFPAILDSEDADGKPVQKPLWPEFFGLEALLRTKASMPSFQWNAQYQQTPTAEEASIVKREWWRIWVDDEPPKCEYIIMSLDAAAEKHNRADYTSLTTWGVFFNEEEEMHNLILLNAIKERMEFPELKELAIREYHEWEPDAFIVEKKSSGSALYQEMRRMDLPVQEYTPHRGSGDKMARLNSVADIIKSELCWVPAKRWAEELVEEIAGFPFMSNDDQVDSTVMALLRFRQGGFIRLPTDVWDDEPEYQQKADYY
jgi:predicted phage terminase large subunit-like protein|tara:strand:+ start:1277 stop:2818 length:1542 start_codon:yes stop_codon:yes gene_type:complete